MVKLIDPVKLANLVKQFNDGDKTKFKEIYEMTWRHVYFAVSRKTADNEEMKDLLQEVYFQIYRSLHKIEDEQSFISWVDRLIDNKFFDFVRKNAKHKKCGDYEKEVMKLIEDDIDVLPEEKTIKNAEHEELHKIIELLPQSQKEIIKLYYFQDKTAKEISVILNISENAVGKKLFDARQAIKKLTEKMSKQYRLKHNLYSLSASPLLVTILVDQLMESSMFAEIIGKEVLVNNLATFTGQTATNVATEITNKTINKTAKETIKQGVQETAQSSVKYTTKNVTQNIITHSLQTAATKTIAVAVVSFTLGAGGVAYVASNIINQKNAQTKEIVSATQVPEITTQENTIKIETPKPAATPTEKIFVVQSETPIASSEALPVPSENVVVPTQIHSHNSSENNEQPQNLQTAIPTEINTAVQQIKVVEELKSPAPSAKPTTQKLPPLYIKASKQYDPSESITTEKFLRDILFALGNSYDFKGATAENFTTDVDLTKAGNYKTTITAKTKGNSKQVEEVQDVQDVFIEVTIKIGDETPPILTIANREIKTKIGIPLTPEQIVELAQINLTDNMDKELTQTFSGLSNINWDEKGEYIVFLSATDNSGNVSKQLSIIISVNESL